MKVQQSSEHYDERCFGDYTGWYIHSSLSRNAEIAKYLGINFVYCVGQYPGKTLSPDVVFIQHGRSIDPRTGKVAYLVVSEFEDICNVVDILKRAYDKQEIKEAEGELEHDMELARYGLL